MRAPRLTIFSKTENQPISSQPVPTPCDKAARSGPPNAFALYYLSPFPPFSIWGGPFLAALSQGGGVSAITSFALHLPYTSLIPPPLKTYYAPVHPPSI